MELTPVSTPPARRRHPLAYVVLALVVVALGVVVYQALSSASLYFYNADEAVRLRTDLGAKRFRLQGTVLGSTIHETDDGVDFDVAYNGAQVEVHHLGDPPELFQPGIPVVLEGRWDKSGDFYDSDRILVKHSANYESDHSKRLEDAKRNGYSDDAATSSTAVP